jgi:hypothetical protein
MDDPQKSAYQRGVKAAARGKYAGVIHPNTKVPGDGWPEKIRATAAGFQANRDSLEGPPQPAVVKINVTLRVNQHWQEGSATGPLANPHQEILELLIGQY